MIKILNKSNNVVFVNCNYDEAIDSQELTEFELCYNFTETPILQDEKKTVFNIVMTLINNYCPELFFHSKTPLIRVMDLQHY